MGEPQSSHVSLAGFEKWGCLSHFAARPSHTGKRQRSYKYNDGIGHPVMDYTSLGSLKVLGKKNNSMGNNEPLVPTSRNTPTSLKAKTETFTLSPTATINSVSHTLKKATGIAKRKSALAPNNVYTPWLTELFKLKAWNTEYVLRNSDSNGCRPHDEEGQQLLEKSISLTVQAKSTAAQRQ
ncbi:hypothetical protein K435DRAFT_965254 [Dendrothele bispora CBS 962.96]|uniref:Uncharacterized protein n=1 Tax=Dendrothele bispora (strain CBS 962.96) TaxID=1314807 RepID=A0A4S8M6B8_DENBC|nr:hypothetical protein K435DRAFT_965254 [Dendrothele bispora CBS 962.96]